MPDDSWIRPAVTRFLELRQGLPVSVRDGIDVILSDRPVDPARADAEAAWEVLRDKPLYAHVRVAAADRWKRELDPFLAGAWQDWGQPGGRLDVVRSGPGRGAAAFTMTGPDAAAIRHASRVPAARLHTMVNAARMLRLRAAASSHPLKDLRQRTLEDLLPSLRRELGWGWGPVTVLHALTDFGVAVKPDIHLIRSLRSLGAPVGPRDSVSPREAIAVNRLVRRMLLAIGEPTPQALRRLDLELMALSQNGHPNGDGISPGSGHHPGSGRRPGRSRQGQSARLR